MQSPIIFKMLLSILGLGLLTTVVVSGNLIPLG